MQAKALLALLAAYALPLVALAHAADHPEAGSSLPLPLVLLGGVVAGVAVASLFYAKRKHLTASVIAGLATAIFASGAVAFFANEPVRQPSVAQAYPELAGKRMEVYKSPGCSCCGGFIDELKGQSADVVVREVSDDELAQVKKRYGIGPELQSCHTTVADGYVVEGHVPFEVLARLLSEKPEIEGIALPGMPSGTPGMPGPKVGPFQIKTLSGSEYATI